VGFNNPDVPWSQLEAVLSGRPGAHQLAVDPLAADGGDSPAWTRHREAYQAPALVRGTSAVDYVELHCHTNFSFLDGASHPEELVEEAYRLGLSGLAVTDHDGLYGVVRFADSARELDLPTVFGAELSIGLPGPQNGQPDPAGRHLLVLARGPQGYAALSRTISLAQLAGGQKGRPVYDLEEVAAALRGKVVVLTGCRKGHVRTALGEGGVAAAVPELDRLVALFGRDSVTVELTQQGYPDDDERNDALAGLAATFGLATVATGNVHYARPGGYRLSTVVAAVRARRSMDELDGWLPAGAVAHLRSGDEMATRFARYPGAVDNAARLGRQLAFDLQLVAPRLPACEVGEGHTEMSWLRHLTMQGALQRYGTRAKNPDAYAQLDRELDTIEALDFPGYFLIVHDIVDFCRRENIYCQGRGSAANSAVCYALGITNVDAVRWGLLFERFLSAQRDGPPDIDVDIESGRREEAIQHVYRRYDRHHTAQVANVISYRPRSAVRDVAKAFGYSPGQQDAWSKQIDRWGSAAVSEVDDLPDHVVTYANLLQTFPRHLGIHSGGMVICDPAVIEVCPVEWARMDNRTVLQWDKDDCAAVGLVKFDLLGLGMLSALHYAFDMIDSELDLAHMPLDDPEVYEMLCRADSVGVFQVESRAQMATLPRLQPRKFYDLVVEVALIRPGPIQGGSVHPYIRRARGRRR
jgi:error-prone DNA polymerase